MGAEDVRRQFAGVLIFRVRSKSKVLSKERRALEPLGCDYDIDTMKSDKGNNTAYLKKAQQCSDEGPYKCVEDKRTNTITDKTGQKLSRSAAD